jgi:23S rRNA pseudouridine1911/1915/1917 synthase
MGRLEILYEDNHLLAINKPAGLPTMGAAAGQASLAEWAKRYLKQKYRKPGRVYLGIVSRLDRPVTGVVVFARTSKAAGRLAQSFRERQVNKTYWALVANWPSQQQGSLCHSLRKDEARRRMVVCPTDHPDAQPAELHFHRLGVAGGWTWLEIELVTGRKHQIRVQLAAVGGTIVGDARYGSRVTFPHGIGLHARRLELIHPVRREPLVIEAPLPSYWPTLPSSASESDRVPDATEGPR